MLKVKDRSAAIREILLIESMIWMLWQRWMIYLFYQWMIAQELHYLLGILNMAVNAERQSFHTLQQDKGIEWGK